MLSGATLGAGIALIVRGLAPPARSLRDELADLHHPHIPAPRRTASTHDDGGEGGDQGQGWGWLARAGRPASRWLAAAGLPRPGIRADLALVDRPVQVHLAEQAAAAMLGVVLPAAMAGVLVVAGIPVGVAIPGWGCLLLAVAGFYTPDLVTRAQASARRAEFTHALGAFLDLVVIGLAGGAGVDAALTQAARVGHGWAFDRIRHTLHTAQITRTTPWTALADLADRLRVPALREVAAAVSLAGTEGAKVRASLAAKASALRLRELTAAEAAAVAATEQMSLPVIVMFAGFLVFIGYPAVITVFTAL
jgi:Flp pilus assembly protein TadB